MYHLRVHVVTGQCLAIPAPRGREGDSLLGRAAVTRAAVFCSPSSSPSTSFCSTSSSPSTTFFADRFRWTCLASGTFSSWLHLWRASGRRDWASRHLCRGTILGASGYLLFVAVLVEDSCGARVGSLLPVLWCKLAVFVYLLFRRVLVACASVARLGTGAALSLSAHPFSFFRCLPR